jgi:hypothetical protein
MTSIANERYPLKIPASRPQHIQSHKPQYILHPLAMVRNDCLAWFDPAHATAHPGITEVRGVGIYAVNKFCDDLWFYSQQP